MLTLFFFKPILPVGKLIGDIIGDLLGKYIYVICRLGGPYSEKL